MEIIEEKMKEIKGKVSKKWDDTKLVIKNNKKIVADVFVALVTLTAAGVNCYTRLKDDHEWVDIKMHVKKDTYDQWTSLQAKTEETEEE